MKKIILLILMLLPATTLASVEITEIMYDVPNTDSGREWIEIYNSGPEAVDLAGLKLFEGNTNHSISFVQGVQAIQADTYAVIADNPEKFLGDWPSFSGALFDSSFSLNNTGETLIIRDSDGNDISSVYYTGDVGAAGDGNSLHKISGTWTPATPSPGAGNSNYSISGSGAQSSLAEGVESGGAQLTPDESTQNSSIFTSISPNLSVSAGSDILSAAGNPVFFNAEVNREYQGRSKNVNYEWSFGDGSILYGQTVTHYFKYAGDYVVVLTAQTEDRRAVDRINVKVVDPKLSIKRLPDGGLEIENSSTNEINLYKWSLVSGDVRFVFPKNTIVRPNAKITIAPEVSGLPIIMTPAVLYNPQEIPEAFFNINVKPAYIPATQTGNNSNQSSVRQNFPAVDKTTLATSVVNSGTSSEGQDANQAAIVNIFEVKTERGIFRKIIEFIGSIF